MTNSRYDPKYVRKCRRRAKFEKIKFTLFWAVPLAVLLILTGWITYYLTIKTTWQNFLYELANDVSYAKNEGSMRAVYEDDVRLDYNNCMNVFNIVADAGPAGPVTGSRGEKKIHIDFGNGHSMDIINIYNDRCFVKYYGEKKYSYKIGVQGMFSKFVQVTSLEGGNYSNTPWSEGS
jgi:hypothetical protein